MKRKRRNLRMLAALGWMAFLLLSAHSSSLAQSRIFHSYNTPTQAPDFALEDLQGKMVEGRDLRGKVLFLNFWATW